jgi:hypothetical protein
MVVNKLALNGFNRSNRVKNINRHWCKGVEEMKKMFGIIMAGALSACLVLPGSSAFAASITASSCSQSAVQSAVDAAQAGDTVSVPSGACTWSGRVSVSKGVTVKGAGPASTVITINGSSIFSLGGNASANYRITGMQFKGTSTSGTDVDINGGWNTMRIDNIKWNTGSSRAIYLGHSMAGDIVYRAKNHAHQRALIHNIEYIPASSTAGKPFILIYGLGYRAWREGDGFGTDNFVFIEDSIFKYTATHYVVDTEMGGRFVFRYNTVTNAGVSMHDMGGQLLGRGNRATEQYNNNLSCSGTGCDGRTGLMSTRGGTGLFYNNIIKGYGMFTWPMMYRVAYNSAFFGGGYCADTGSRKVCQDLAKRCTISNKPCYQTSDCGSGGGECPNSGGGLWCDSNSDCKNADGTYGLCMQVDGLGRTGSEAPGWPCRDQTGRGKDDPTTGAQELSPVYWWNNTVDGVANKSMLVGSQYSAYIKQGRDYCNNSPASACGSKAAWRYTAYPYPHPLRTGEVAPPPPTPSTFIDPPAAVRVVQ